MSTLTIELDNALAQVLEASARRESKPVSEWATERLRMAAAMEASAAANGYPVGWLKLFGSISDSDGFTSPDRTAVRAVDALDRD